MLKKEKIIMEEIIGAFQALNAQYGSLANEEISGWVYNAYLVHGSKSTMGLHFLYHYIEADIKKFNYCRDEFNARLQLQFDSLIEMNKLEHGTAGSAEDMFLIIKLLQNYNDALTMNKIDDYTKTHSEKVRKGAVRMGELLGICDVADLEICALLHDIGKLSIPRMIINKPASLDEYEWNIIREHPVYGAQILKTSSAMFGDNIIEGVYHHHSNIDGSGYPGCERLKQPLFAQIIRVCDSFEAMTSNRKYRDAQSLDFAFSELQKFSGTMYNPEIVKLFMDFNVYRGF
jgi:putative nucleotidyltransferase with HDIG domain